MFHKFTSIFQHASAALAVPDVSRPDEFKAHWKKITHYFIDNQDQKRSIDQTTLPQSFASMMSILVAEEADVERHSTGPCMEYLLQHKILETLITLARTDTPPGMKQNVLQFLTKLLSRIKQPLLPHVHVHKPMQRIVKLCGEITAGPTETDEIQFLLMLCAKLRADPYLVNFFIEGTNKSEDSSSPLKTTYSPSKCAKPGFPLVNSLLCLMESPDARVCVKCCEAVMLLTSVPEAAVARAIVDHTDLAATLAQQLARLYHRLPKVMSPTEIEGVEAKWGLDVHCSLDDQHYFVGKRELIAFLSWLDFLDQLIGQSHDIVASGLAVAVQEYFLQKVLEPSILQTSEAGAITSTAHLTHCFRSVSSPALLHELIVFTLGSCDLASHPVETPGGGQHKLRKHLLTRCDHLTDEMSLASLQLFDVLLCKCHEDIFNNLVLRNLRTRSYTSEDTDVPDPLSPPTTAVRQLNFDSSNEINAAADSSSEQDLNNSGVNSETALTSGNESVEHTGSVVDVSHSTADHSESVSSRAESEQASSASPEALHFDVEDKDGELLHQDRNSGSEQMCVAAAEQNSNQSSNIESRSLLSASALSYDIAAALPEVEVGAPDGGVQIGAPEVDGGVLRDDVDGDVMQMVMNGAVVGDTEAEEEQLSPSNRSLSPSNSLLPEDDFSLLTPPESPSSMVSSVPIEAIVNSFLNILPSEIKTSVDAGDADFSSYLSDAHRQLHEWHCMCAKFNWPRIPCHIDTETGSAVRCEEVQPDETPFYEGDFLKMLFDKLSHMLDQSYDVNLSVTSLVSRLTMLPHPNLGEFLLNPLLPAAPSGGQRRSLHTVLSKVAHDVETRVRSTTDLQKKLIDLRKQMLVYNTDIQRKKGKDKHNLEDSNLLAGVIVLEEFCKELAAIAFVKQHAALTETPTGFL